MTDTTGAAGSEAFDAAPTTNESTGPDSPELAKAKGDVLGYETQLADAEVAIERARGKLDKAHGFVTDAEAGIASHEAERDEIQAKLDEARAALGAHEEGT